MSRPDRYDSSTLAQRLYYQQTKTPATLGSEPSKERQKPGADRQPKYPPGQPGGEAPGNQPVKRQAARYTGEEVANGRSAKAT